MLVVAHHGLFDAEVVQQLEGFLSVKASSRRERLGQVKDDPRTLIFYEAQLPLLIPCVRRHTFGRLGKGDPAPGHLHHQLHSLLEGDRRGLLGLCPEPFGHVGYAQPFEKGGPKL